MAIYQLDETLWFPDVEEAEESGLLAIGGDLRSDRIAVAYLNGIFPWYDEESPILWWAPDPRFVLFPNELRISKSMRQVIKSGKFTFRVNTAFRDVIRYCGSVNRGENEGTWINEDIIAGFTALHDAGVAISAETWHDDKLVGGLYGIRMGGVFFGESMFSLVSNASKFAFIMLVQLLKSKYDLAIIDCQIYSPHLESLGAKMIPRKQFMEILVKNTQL